MSDKVKTIKIGTKIHQILLDPTYFISNYRISWWKCLLARLFGIGITITEEEKDKFLVCARGCLPNDLIIKCMIVRKKMSCINNINQYVFPDDVALQDRLDAIDCIENCLQNFGFEALGCVSLGHPETGGPGCQETVIGGHIVVICD